MKKKNIGSSFDSRLREEGIHEEVTATAIKRVLARQVEMAMKEKNFPRPKWRAACTQAAPHSTDCSTRKTMLLP